MKAKNITCNNALCTRHEESQSGCKKRDIKNLERCEIYRLLNPKLPPNKLKDQVSTASAWKPSETSEPLETIMMSMFTFNRMASALGCRYCSIRDTVNCPGDDTIATLQVCYDHWSNFIAEDNLNNSFDSSSKLSKPKEEP